MIKDPKKVGSCWTDIIQGSIPTDANCFMWDNNLGQDVNLYCASLHPGENMGTQQILASVPCMAATGKVTKASYPCWGNTV